MPLTFADADFSGKGEKTRKERPLVEMEQIVPWQALIRLIAPFHPEAGNGQRPYLTVNPGGDLMTETEVRRVQQAFRGAKYRDKVEIQLRPAATLQDLMDDLNDVRQKSADCGSARHTLVLAAKTRWLTFVDRRQERP